MSFADDGNARRWDGDRGPDVEIAVQVDELSLPSFPNGFLDPVRRTDQRPVGRRMTQRGCKLHGSRRGAAGTRSTRDQDVFIAGNGIEDSQEMICVRPVDSRWARRQGYRRRAGSIEVSSRRLRKVKIGSDQTRIIGSAAAEGGTDEGSALPNQSLAFRAGRDPGATVDRREGALDLFGQLHFGLSDQRRRGQDDREQEVFFHGVHFR